MRLGILSFRVGAWNTDIDSKIDSPSREEGSDSHTEIRRGLIGHRIRLLQLGHRMGLLGGLQFTVIGTWFILLPWSAGAYNKAFTSWVGPLF